MAGPGALSWGHRQAAPGLAELGVLGSEGCWDLGSFPPPFPFSFPKASLIYTLTATNPIWIWSPLPPTPSKLTFNPLHAAPINPLAAEHIICVKRTSSPAQSKAGSAGGGYGVHSQISKR